MQATPAQQGTSTKPQAKSLGSLNKNGANLWLVWATQELKEAKVLEELWYKQANGTVRDAIWSGYYELKRKGEESTQKLRDRGGLLFFGQPAAIKAARTIAEA